MISLVYPAFCRGCDYVVHDNSVFCDACRASIKPIPSIFLSLGNYPPEEHPSAIEIHAVSAYDDPLRPLILRKRYADRLAGRQLGALMSEQAALKTACFDYIVPIPLHWTRYARRGFNQSYEMAVVVGRALGVPVVRLLARSCRTKYQSKLSPALRKKNVEGVFAVRRMYRDIYCSIVHDKRILFVDDLCTTGVTLKQAARVLLKGKPRSIGALVACRVV